MIDSDSGDRLWLGYFEWTASCLCDTRAIEEVLLVEPYLTMHDVEHGNHIITGFNFDNVLSLMFVTSTPNFPVHLQFIRFQNGTFASSQCVSKAEY